MNCKMSGIHSHPMEEEIEEMDQKVENQDQVATDSQEILITSSGTHVPECCLKLFKVFSLFLCCMRTLNARSIRCPP